MLKKKISRLKDGAMELYLQLREVDELPLRLIQGDFSDRQTTLEKFREERRLKLEKKDKAS